MSVVANIVDLLYSVAALTDVRSRTLLCPRTSHLPAEKLSQSCH